MYRTPSLITKRNIPTVQEHPDQKAQAPHLKSLINIFQDGLQGNQHFQHCCHLLYLSTYPRQVGNQSNLSKKELTPEE